MANRYETFVRRQTKQWRRSGVCKTCRAWYLECNGAKPCNHCINLEITCEPDNPSPGAIVSAPSSRKGGAAFYRYLKQIEILIPGDKWPQAHYYYWKGLLPVAQDDITIMNALFCKVVLNELSPGDPIPKATIQNYSQSLARPNKRDLRLLLMATNMYIDIEMFLIHWKNVDTLLSSSFAILYAMKTYVENRYLKDELFYWVAVELSRLLTEIHKDCRLVTIERWTWLNDLLSQIARNLRLPQGYIIELQMQDIVYRLGQKTIDTEDIQFRIAAWDHICAQYRKTISEDSTDATYFNTLSWRFGMPRLWWNSYLWWTEGDQAAGDFVKKFVEERTVAWENLNQNSFLNRGFGPRSVSRHINHALLHLMVGLNWHIRDPAIAERLIQVIKSYRKWIKHSGRVIGYMRILAATSFTERTALEKETFPDDHQFFLSARDIHRVAFRLFEEPCPPSLQGLDAAESLKDRNDRFNSLVAQESEA